MFKYLLIYANKYACVQFRIFELYHCSQHENDINVSVFKNGQKGALVLHVLCGIFSRSRRDCNIISFLFRNYSCHFVGSSKFGIFLKSNSDHPWIAPWCS